MFAVPKVFVSGPLPSITGKVTIDAHHTVEISGAGLDLKAPGNIVKGLTINGASGGPGLGVSITGDGATVAGANVAWG